jgi:truncated hemoglobin YjbI
MVTDDRVDITERSDVENLVNAFYDKVRRDDLIGPIFSGAPGWLCLFIRTLHELFSEPTAQSAENYALGIAETFQRRPELLPVRADRSSFQEIKLFPGMP